MRVAAALALLLPATIAWSQEGGPTRIECLDEAAFLAGVPRDAPALRALLERSGLARADGVAARTLADPELEARREAPRDATEQIDLGLSWQPPRPDRRRLAVAAAESGVAAAEHELALGRAEVRTAVREDFAGWALAAHRERILESLASELDRLTEIERRRADAGEVSGLAARRMALAASEARAELARARADLERGRAAAAVWRPDLAPEVEPVPPSPPPAPGLDSTHPRLAALESELERARLEGELAARVVALPELTVGWQRQRDDAGLDAEGPVFGLVWPLPLLDRHRADRARAEVRIDALEARLEQARLELAAERAGTLGAYRTLAAAAGAARADAASAAAVAAAAAEAFRLGEATVTDLLDTFRAAAGARLRSVDLLGEALAAHRELERLSGREPEEAPAASGAPVSCRRYGEESDASRDE